LNAECGISALRIPHSYQAPASVQSRPHESRQDRKVATVVSFGCAAAVTGACPISIRLLLSRLFLSALSLFPLAPSPL